MADTFFPSKGSVEKLANKTQSTLDFFTLVQFDKNKNIRRKTDGDVKNKKFYKVYQHYIQLHTLQYLHQILVPGIKSGHLTFKNFISFLAKETWLGKPYLKSDLGGEMIEVNWLSLISPAICEYFVQVQAWTLSNGSYSPNFILCIDSLTLKMEGIMRNFAERLNVSMTVVGKKGTQEAYVSHVLDNEIIREYFGEDDVQFFKYLFANEGGLNLRNSVAHCLYNFSDYGLAKMN